MQEGEARNEATLKLKNYETPIHNSQFVTVLESNNREKALVNGYLKKYFFCNTKNKSFNDELINHFTLIIIKYYIYKMKCFSKINKFEGTGIFADQNNAMIIFPKILNNLIKNIDYNNLTKTKLPIITIESKHTTSMFSMSFGLVAINKNYITEIFNQCVEYISNNNVVGSFSCWLAMKNKVSQINERYWDNLKIYGFKAPIFGIEDQRFLGLANKITDRYIRKGDLLKIVIDYDKIISFKSKKLGAYLFHNDCKIFEFSIDCENFLYFPFIGDTYNNNFEFDITIN